MTNFRNTFVVLRLNPRNVVQGIHHIDLKVRGVWRLFGDFLDCHSMESDRRFWKNFVLLLLGVSSCWNGDRFEYCLDLFVC